MTLLLDELIRSLVDRRTGILRSIEYVPPIPNGPIIHTYRAFLAAPYSFMNGSYIREGGEHPIAAGCNLELDAALWALIGEALERYSAFSFDSSRVVAASYASVQDSAIDPDEWIGFDADSFSSDFPYRPHDPDEKIRWVYATDYLDGAQRLVPAIHVWLRLGEILPSERFAQRASTGLGAGTNLALAQLSGLLEVLERDAFASRWIMSAKPNRVHGPQDICNMFSDRSGVSGISIELFDITLYKLVPVILAKLSLPNRDFGFCLGASAALDYETACRKAVLEAYHILQGTISWKNRTGMEMLPENIKDFVDHGRFYSQKRRGVEADWFFDKNGQKPAFTGVLNPNEPVEINIGRIARFLREWGYHAYFIDITPDEIKELGFHVVKTVVPGLQPLTCGAKIVADDSRRLTAIGEILPEFATFSINRQIQPFA